MTKTVLITGANRGIGFALVKQYATSEYNILACSRHPEEAAELQQLSASNKNISIHTLDVSKESQIKALANSLQNISIDILINNAGIAGKDQPLDAISEEEMLNIFQVNTVGPVMMVQALHSLVGKSQQKTIVNISSMLGSIEENKTGGMFWLPYRVSKTALNSASRCLANNLKSQGIIVVAMDPGWVQTDMGGQNADIKPETSASGIMQTVDKLTLQDSGKYFRYNGENLPW